MATPLCTCQPASRAGTWIRRTIWGAPQPTYPGRSAWSHLPSPILGHVRTGILGGTFDPIHIAHLHVGEVAMHQAALDRVVFMPAGDPWQKAEGTITAASHRLAMVRLAVTGVEGFQVDDRELARDGPTYTIDTLASFPDEEDLFLILGADAAAGLSTWHRHEEVLERATILVAPRNDVDITGVMETVPSAMLLDMTTLGISGSAIREMAATGAPFRFLLPEAVYRYIADNSLYTQEGEHDMVGDPTNREEQS